MMHATQINMKEFHEKSMVLTRSAFVKICRDLKVFPVSKILDNNKKAVVSEESFMKVVDFCCMKR